MEKTIYRRHSLGVALVIWCFCRVRDGVKALFRYALGSRIFHRLLLAVAGWCWRRGRDRMICRDYFVGASELYLERFYLVRSRLLGIFLHRFWKSDREGAHDHPWDFVTIVLRGGYFEQTPGKARWRGPGSIIFHKAEEFHRIFIPSDLRGNTWTLFVHGPRRRRWGFLTPDGWKVAT